MTKEEREKAIDLLDNLLGMVEDNQDNDYDKALRMGIESLRKEPCEDSVSRSEVKKIAKEMYLEVANMKLDVTTISDCISYTSSKCREVLERKLQTLPSVTPTISEIDKFNDNVNRVTVLNLINDVKNADGFNDYSSYEYLFDQVDKMPMATPTRRKEKNESSSENPNKWIPCSERLPKENVKVLTQDYDGDIQVDWLVDLELRWFYSQHHIVAWQPLPKPYKAEKGE